MTAPVEPTAEEEAYNLAEMHEELEALERGRHIQQVKLETNGGAYQPEEWFERVGYMPTQEEMTEIKISEEEIEQHLDDETVELRSVAEWQLNAAKGDKESMWDRVDLPTDKE
jgi:hypothetical protein